MTKTFPAVFDGQVLRPEKPAELKANVRYIVTVEQANGDEETAKEDYPLTTIRLLAKDMGVSDLSTRHSSYARGQVYDDTNES